MSGKQKALNWAQTLGFYRVAEALTRAQVRILCYHGLWVTPGFQYGNRLFLPPEQFEARMAALRASGRPLISLERAVQGLATGTVPPGAVVVTIDDGWASTYSHMLPSLERHRVPATLYVTSWYVDKALPIVNKAVDYLFQASVLSELDARGLGDAPAFALYPLADAAGRFEQAQAVAAAMEALPLAERLPVLTTLGARAGIADDWLHSRQFHLMTSAELADAAARGLDLQLHTHRHIHVSDHLPDLAAEVSENRAFLARATGLAPESFRHFCYPSGEFHAGAAAVLQACGVTSATLCEEGLNRCGVDPYRLRRFLDGRTVSAAEFEAYLHGALDLYEGAKALAFWRKSR